MSSRHRYFLALADAPSVAAHPDTRSRIDRSVRSPRGLSIGNSRDGRWLIIERDLVPDALVADAAALSRVFDCEVTGLVAQTTASVTDYVFARNGTVVRRLSSTDDGWTFIGDAEPWETLLFSDEARELALESRGDDTDRAEVDGAFTAHVLVPGATWPRFDIDVLASAKGLPIDEPLPPPSRWTVRARDVLSVLAIVVGIALAVHDAIHGSRATSIGAVGFVAVFVGVTVRIRRTASLVTSVGGGLLAGAVMLSVVFVACGAAR
jgi:hypothetical protein